MTDSGVASEPRVVQGSGIKCPSCGSEAVYRYGKAKTGKQRFLCLICGMQFTNGSKVSTIKGKPVCSQCGRTVTTRVADSAIRFTALP